MSDRKHDLTEKEKMQRQMLYDANYDQELKAERLHAKELCYEYNHLRPTEETKQKAIIKELLGKTKKSFDILAPFFCDYGYHIEIGENFFSNYNLQSGHSGLCKSDVWGQCIHCAELRILHGRSSDRF